MPTIHQLEYILAVHSLGHFGRAAKACQVSQPTLSAQIQRVEEELGVVLFNRGTKPISTTDAGRGVIGHAQAVVAAHQRLVDEARSHGESVSGGFALGIIPTLAPYVLPWFLNAFVRNYPNVDLAIYERPTDAIIEEIRHQRLDGAILATPLDEPGIQERPLFYDSFYLYANRKDPLLSGTEVSQGDLSERKIWLLEDGHCLRNQVINFCKVRDGRTSLGSVSFAAGSLETLRHLIDAYEGYTLIPETYARTLPKDVRTQQVRPFSERTPVREVSLIYARQQWKTKILDALFESLVDNAPRALRQTNEKGEVVALR